jgi:hypothetical protein
MTEEERTRLLFALEQILERLGLGFVVAQERVIAAEGRSLTSEELTTHGQALDIGSTSGGFTDRQSSGRTASLWDMDEAVPSVGKERLKSGDIVVTPLDVRSRLALLLDLVEVATAGTVAMEQVVVDELRADPTDGLLAFEEPPEAELRSQTRGPWTLTADTVGAQARRRARDVVSVVDELRDLAEVPRGQWLEPYERGDSAYSWSTGEQ